MRVDITIKQGCLWIESHAENALNESKRHMAVSGKIQRSKRGFSATANDYMYACNCTPEFKFCAPSQLPNCSNPLLFLFLLFLQHIVFLHFCEPHQKIVK